MYIFHKMKHKLRNPFYTLKFNLFQFKLKSDEKQDCLIASMLHFVICIECFLIYLLLNK